MNRAATLAALALLWADGALAAGDEARFERARSLAWQGRHAEAEAEFSRLVRARPDNADFLLGLAQARLWGGNPEGALEPLRKARRLAPRYADVWRLQIQALLALGDPERLRQARIVRDEARRRFPGSNWEFAQLDEAPPPPPVARPVPPPAPPAVPAADARPPPPPAPPEKANHREWEAGFSWESLTHNQPDWTSSYLRGEWRRPDGAGLYGGLRQTERYGLRDEEIHLGGLLPLSPAAIFQLEAGYSGSHQVLAARYGFAALQYRPAPGWSLEVGLRLSDFEAGATQVAHFSLDRYLGNERFGYTFYLGGPEGAGPSPSHRFQWAHYYGEDNWAGLTLVRGRESEHIPGGFLTSRVEGGSLAGRHGVAAGWSITWEAGILRQGDFYTRRGVRLGLRHSF